MPAKKFIPPAQRKKAAEAAAASAASSAAAADAPAAAPSALESAIAAAAASAPAAGAGAGAGAGGDDAAAAAAAADAWLTEALPGDEHAHRLMAEAMSALSITTSTYASKIHPNTRDIAVSALTVILKGKELLVDAELKLAHGCRYALVGPNGCGKSILMTLVGKRMVPLPANLDLFHLANEIEPSDMTALEAVTAVDVERTRLMAAIASLEELVTGEESEEQAALSESLCEFYERADALGAENAEAKAAGILHGLGFSAHAMGKRCRDFSGGWRMRIALARALFVHPTCLLLDEPTAHLDMEAVVWLERYLAAYKGIILLVSHSQDFLNNVCTDTIRMHGRKLTYYGGNYDTYVATRAEQEENHAKRYEKQQADIAEVKDFIARFGHGTQKMVKQAQSREKLLAKILEDETIEKVERDKNFTMRFPDPGKLPPPVLMLQNLSFNYPGGPTLFSHVDFGVDLESRIALVGPNGMGKTTLLKMLTGELVPSTGAVRPHNALRIARYSQHYVDAFDLNQTPLEHFIGLMPDVSVAEVRAGRGVGR
jgi:ATP-binding cassette subfamily F protein 2